MPDQPGGNMGTESLSTEQSSQRTSQAGGNRGRIFNNTPSDMSQWKNNITRWFGAQSGVGAGAGAGRQPINKEQTAKTMWGSANPSVAGGMVKAQSVQGMFKSISRGKKPDKTLAEKMQIENTTKGPVTQAIANPGSSQHNRPKRESGPFTTPKEASMEAKQQRIEQTRGIVKFAACMRKARKKKKKLNKAGEAEVPGISAAAPLGAGALGAGSVAAAGGAARNLSSIVDRVGQVNPRAASFLANLARGASEGAAESKTLSSLGSLGGGSKLKAYGARPAMGAAMLGAPAMAGARAAKSKGGAGRGAAAGAVTGASTAGILAAIVALASRKPGAVKGLAKTFPGRAAVGAGVGAGAGAVGGAMQKKKRTKAEGKTEDKDKDKGKDKKDEKKEEKKAALRKAALPWSKILGGGLLGMGALGAGAGALAAGPPLLRGARHHISMMADPMYKQDYDWKKMVHSPQMMMLNMIRGGGFGQGGGHGMPPALSPDDQKMFQHATYLQGLRARTRALQEAFKA